MTYLQPKVRTAWVFFPLGMSLGLRPRDIPRGKKTQAVPPLGWRYIPVLHNKTVMHDRTFVQERSVLQERAVIKGKNRCAGKSSPAG